MIRAGPPLPPRVSGSQWMSLLRKELNAANKDGRSASGGEYQNHRLVSLAMSEHLGLPCKGAVHKERAEFGVSVNAKDCRGEILSAVSFHDSTDSLSKHRDFYISRSCSFQHKTGVHILTYHVMRLFVSPHSAFSLCFRGPLALAKFKCGPGLNSSAYGHIWFEYTSSHPITEVKQPRARSVLGWVTAWEHRVL